MGKNHFQIQYLNYRDSIRLRKKFIDALTKKGVKYKLSRRIFLNSRINELNEHLEFLKKNNLDKMSGAVRFKLWHVVVLLIIGIGIYIWVI